MFLFWAMCMFTAGVFGWWLKGRRVEAHVCMDRPAALTPWERPDHSQDRPPREYVTIRCPDPTCNDTVDLPVKRIKINHSGVDINVAVDIETHDLSVHTFSHPWNA